jgi:hypothetical protein
LEALHHQHGQASIIGGVKEKPLVSGVTEFELAQEDPIVTQLLPGLSVDLGARYLVSGVNCNDLKKYPILVLLVLIFFTSSWRHASSCIYHLAYFYQTKIILYNVYFILLVGFNKTLNFSYFKTKTIIFANFCKFFETKFSF